MKTAEEIFDWMLENKTKTNKSFCVSNINSIIVRDHLDCAEARADLEKENAELREKCRLAAEGYEQLERVRQDELNDITTRLGFDTNNPMRKCAWNYADDIRKERDSLRTQLIATEALCEKMREALNKIAMAYKHEAAELPTWCVDAMRDALRLLGGGKKEQ